MAAIDERRFGELYQEYERYVRALCRRAIQQEEDAEDVAMLAFARAFRAVRTYDPAVASFKTWLTHITVNTIRDHFRRQKHAPLHLPDGSDGEPELEAPGNDDGALLRTAVHTCLHRLPDNQRQVFLLHDQLEYTWEEIAARTEYTVSQARTLREHARRSLHACLQAHGIHATE
jgi:RNA polymerase sigma factor (sigma-70 family)